VIGLKVGEKPLLRALQRRQRQLRGDARVLLDQGAGRSADLAAPAPEGRRRDHRQPQRPPATLVIDNLEEGRNLYLIGTAPALRRS